VTQVRKQDASTQPHAGTARAQAAPPLRVVLVADDAGRLAAWRCAIETADAPWRVESFSAYGEAMLRSTHLGPHCLVLDAEENSVLGAAVRRFLARSAPQVRALWVGDPAAEGALPSRTETRALQLQLAEIARRGLSPLH
jgi:hypothetical protein